VHPHPDIPIIKVVQSKCNMMRGEVFIINAMVK
jgi:hypothetical protein